LEEMRKESSQKEGKVLRPEMSEVDQPGPMRKRDDPRG